MVLFDDIFLIIATCAAAADISIVTQWWWWCATARFNTVTGTWAKQCTFPSLINEKWEKTNIYDHDQLSFTV